MSALRVVLADDNLLARRGLRSVLNEESSIEIVGEADNGAEAVELCRQHRPEVAILDMRMPGLDGVAVTAQLQKDVPATRVLIVSHYDDSENLVKALRAGAVGYLAKEQVDAEQLLEAVNTVAGGGRYFPAALEERLQERTMLPDLSVRENQVLAQLARGLTNQEIADTLGLTLRTVRKHVSGVLDKLAARTRTEAVTVAIKRGILPG